MSNAYVQYTKDDYAAKARQIVEKISRVKASATHSGHNTLAVKSTASIPLDLLHGYQSCHYLCVSREYSMAIEGMPSFVRYEFTIDCSLTPLYRVGCFNREIQPALMASILAESLEEAVFRLQQDDELLLSYGYQRDTSKGLLCSYQRRFQSVNHSIQILASRSLSEVKADQVIDNDYWDAHSLSRPTDYSLARIAVDMEALITSSNVSMERTPPLIDALVKLEVGR